MVRRKSLGSIKLATLRGVKKAPAGQPPVVGDTFFEQLLDDLNGQLAFKLRSDVACDDPLRSVTDVVGDLELAEIAVATVGSSEVAGAIGLAADVVAIAYVIITARSARRSALHFGPSHKAIADRFREIERTAVKRLNNALLSVV